MHFSQWCLPQSASKYNTISFHFVTVLNLICRITVIFDIFSYYAAKDGGPIKQGVQMLKQIDEAQWN